MVCGLLLTAASAVHVAEKGALNPGMVNPDYEEQPAWFKASFLDLREDLDESAADGRRLLPGVLDVAMPLKRDQRMSRPLMVLFEQLGCRECDQLHNEIFRDPAVATAMSNLDVAQIDLRTKAPLTTPDGRESTTQAWARDLGIQHAPSLVLFDSNGHEVFRTEAFLRTFHVHDAIDYVVGGAYARQPSFQRFLQHRTERLHDLGIEVALMR